MLKQLDRVFARVSLVLAFAGAGLVGLLAVLVVADVIGRQIGTPILGVVELAAMTVVISGFLTIPYVLRRGSHIRATVIVDRLPQGARKVFEVIAYLAAITVFALLAYSSYGEFIKAFVAGSYEGEGSLRVPTWPARFVIFVSSMLMIIEGFLAIGRSLTGKEEEDDDE